MFQLGLFPAPAIRNDDQSLAAGDWLVSSTSALPWPTDDDGSDALLGPLGYHIMLRARWDPAEQSRASGPRGRARLKSLRQVLEQSVPRLREQLLKAWSYLDAEDAELARAGATFHALVMTAFDCRWGGDVFAGTRVERALWSLYDDGSLVFRFVIIEHRADDDVIAPVFVPAAVAR